MKIREADYSDAEAIAELHTSSWRNTYKNALNAEYLKNNVPSERKSVWLQRLSEPKANQFVTVAEIEGKIIGFSCAFADEDTDLGSYFDNLHVNPLNQGNGIGTLLLKKAAQHCFQQAPRSGMYLLVNQDNIKAQQFYEVCGARNLESGVWNAPDGSDVPTYILYWDTLSELIKNG
jgi:ribosomal protein S18 acetylase RimI-like enzyme